MSGVSIRPNLNAKGQVTIHSGVMGRKIDSLTEVTIRCTGVTVRPSGQRKAEEEGDKTVHASLNGDLIPFVPVTDSAIALTYNPHKGDKDFYIDLPTGREIYNGGGIVTMVGWKAWLIL